MNTKVDICWNVQSMFWNNLHPVSSKSKWWKDKKSKRTQDQKKIWI